MFDKCANPECALPFDYKQGRLFRFPHPRATNQPPVNAHSIQHLWLCGRCSQTLTLHYHREHGVAVTPRFPQPHPRTLLRVIKAA